MQTICKQYCFLWTNNYYFGPWEIYRFNGSTLQVMGVLPPEGEWAIVGGTGELAMARGTIKHRAALPPPPPGSTFGFRQLDILALYPKNSAECMKNHM